MSLKALRIRSTSISRWNAVASRFSSLSISSADGWLGLEELAEGFGVDDEASDMAHAVKCLLPPVSEVNLTEHGSR